MCHFFSSVPRHSKIILKQNDPEHRLEKDPSQPEHGEQPKSRLSTLEQLQYQLTTQVTLEGRKQERDFNQSKFAIDTENLFHHINQFGLCKCTELKI